MADTTQEHAPGHHPDLPPPVATVGAIGWLRANLFSTWYNSLLTLGAIYLVYLIVPPFFEWAFANAYWSGDTREACFSEIDGKMVREGACWVFIKVWFPQFIYGFYPDVERWRVNVAFLILILTCVPLFIPAFRWKHWIGLFLLVGYPIIAYFLFVGDSFGLVFVETDKWGGLFLTLVIAGVGIVMSLPIGVVLALGRRSQMPIVRAICVAFIELWRGVPLITVLFMASVMFPLFVPHEFDVNKLLRALIGVMLFSAAYMAEVVRGGLQAIPKGQYEGAQALGLGYWQMMGLIVLPQALKMVIPGIVNTFIGLFKDTTLVLVISLFDFLNMVKLAGTNPNWLGFAIEGYVFAAAVFWVFCFGMSRYSIHIEEKLHTGHKR